MASDKRFMRLVHSQKQVTDVDDDAYVITFTGWRQILPRIAQKLISFAIKSQRRADLRRNVWHNNL